MLEMNGEIKLPKHIIVKDEETGLAAYLPPNILTPTKAFSFHESSESFIVTKADEGTKDKPEDSFESPKIIFSNE